MQGQLELSWRATESQIGSGNGGGNAGSWKWGGEVGGWTEDFPPGRPPLHRHPPSLTSRPKPVGHTSGRERRHSWSGLGLWAAYRTLRGERGDL